MHVQIAMPWIQLGFVSLLEMDQILILWDRLSGMIFAEHFRDVFLQLDAIIGYMDPLLLAVLAAAVFVMRSDSLMQVL